MVKDLTTSLSRVVHSTNRHQIQAIISIALVLLIYTAGFVCSYIFYFNKSPKIDETTFDPTLMDASVRPLGSKISGVVIPDASDEDGMKACALELYNLANYNLKNDDCVAYAVNTNTEVLGVQTGGIRYTIKNKNEFFHADYFYVPKGTAGRFAKAASPEYTNYGYRYYYNTNTMKGHEQKARELDYEITATGATLFGVNWTNLYYDRDVTDVPSEFAISNKSYKYYNYVWSEESILSASVEYFEDKGYYELVVEIDTKNTEAIKEGLVDLRNGAGDEDAYYTKIVETVQIWDNGRYKQFNTKDDWYSPHIHGLFISASSYNDYHCLCMTL